MPLLNLTEEQVMDLVKQLPPERRAAIHELASGATEPTMAIETRFRQLVDEWKQATRLVSSVHDMVTHPAYLQIIGMGKKAVPLLIDELRREPDHWFVALQAITAENPVLPSAPGDVDKMTQAWLCWAEQHGL